MARVPAVIALLASLASSLPAQAASIILDPPSSPGFYTLDPGGFAATLDNGESLIVDLSITIHPLCVRPFELDVLANPAAPVANLSGVQINGCGGDTTIFQVQLNGDGAAHFFDVEFVDAEFGGVVASMPGSIVPSGFEVPEPGTIGLVLVGLLACRARRLFALPGRRCSD